MASFDLCYSFLLPNEDYTPPRYEVTPDPTKDDPEAKALAGINSARWPKEFLDIVALPGADRAEAVKSFYHANFWNKWLDQLNSSRIAAIVLDASVNQGLGWGAKFLQVACGVTADGLLGPITVAAANASDPEVLVPAFVEARQARYREVGGPSLPAWIARAARIPMFI